MENLKKGSNKKFDDSVGALVWVRRGNGSWWPGKILAPEELQEESLISTKSGSPVILLGKEDALEWYDLDTSKCVKAFRCGEFNTCIKKAESIALKKGKYTNREAAIVTALELESARVGGKKYESNSDPELPQSGTSFEDLNTLEDDETDGGKLVSSGDGSSLKRKRSQRISIKSKAKNPGPEWGTTAKRSSRRNLRKSRKRKAVRFVYADQHLFSWRRKLGSKTMSMVRVNKSSVSTRSNQKPPRPSKPYVQTLFDVNVQVDSSRSRRPNHVPYISLMSKMNDRPIVGHPVEVEVLTPVVSCLPVTAVFSRLKASLNF